MSIQRYTFIDLLPLLGPQNVKASCIWRNEETAKLATIYPSTYDGYFFIWWIDGKTATQTELAQAVKIEYLEEAFAAMEFDVHAGLWLPERCTPWSKLPFGQPEKRTQFVYFIGGAGLIKIGVAEFPENRLEDLQCASPTPLTLLGVCKGGVKRETELHKQFADQRIRGEWFIPSEELWEVIEECKLS